MPNGRELESGQCEMSDEPVKKKNELLRLLSAVESQAPNLEALGQDIARSARLSRDIASCVRDLVSQIPHDNLVPDEQWNQQIDGWRSWEAVANGLQGSHTLVNSFVAVSEATTVTTSGAMFDLTFISPASPPLQKAIETAKTRFSQAVERFPLADEARASMKRLHLDSRGGTYRTAMELLIEAEGALDRPVFNEGGPVSVLIPLRECINVAVSELIRRRPTQEPASKIQDKIASIGQQCARPGLVQDHFACLGANATKLLDDLSAAKQAEVSRERLTEIFHRGLLLLNALMNSIDEARLRSA